MCGMVVCGKILGGIELSGWWLCVCFFGCVWLCAELCWVELNCLVGGCVCFFWLCMVVCGMVQNGIKLFGLWLCVFFLVVYGCVWNGSGWD